MDYEVAIEKVLKETKRKPCADEEEEGKGKDRDEMQGYK